MATVDWIIVVILGLAIVGGIAEGFLRSASSLAGLFLGLLLAAWNYPTAARLFLPIVRIPAIADTVGFLLIAVLVMAIVGLIGRLLSKTAHSIGLGCIDRLIGGVFGFFQGALLVTICILVTLAFFPSAHWLTQGRLPRAFFGVCHLTTHVTPADLANRVRHTLNEIEEESPRWMHPNAGAGGL